VDTPSKDTSFALGTSFAPSAEKEFQTYTSNYKVFQDLRAIKVLSRYHFASADHNSGEGEFPP